MTLNDAMGLFYRKKMGDVPSSVVGTFTATGQSSTLELNGLFNVLISGGVGTVQLERSFDSGSTWYAVSKNTNGDDAAYTTSSDTGFNGTIEEPEGDILYRLNCTAYTSGTITYRISQ